MNDLARTLAFAFRRKGLAAMGGADLRLLLAYDLRWFAPEDAKRVVARGIETGLLILEGDDVRPSFDITTVEIPVNFRPGPHVIEETAPPLPPAKARAPPAPAPAAPPAPAPTAAPVVDAHERAAEDERRKRGLLMSVEVARLVVRRRAGEDVSADAAALEGKLLGG